MTKSITRLTWNIFDKFGDRKKHGSITFIINTVTEEVYPIPKILNILISYVCF